MKARSIATMLSLGLVLVLLLSTAAAEQKPEKSISRQGQEQGFTSQNTENKRAGTKGNDRGKDRPGSSGTDQKGDGSKPSNTASGQEDYNAAANSQPDPTPQRRTENPTKPRDNDPGNSDGGFARWVLDWSVYGLVGVILVGGIVAGLHFLFQMKRKARDKINATFDYFKREQREMRAKVDALEKISTDLSNQSSQNKANIALLSSHLADLETNVGAAMAPTSPTPPRSSYQPPIVERVFPTSTEAYLSKHAQAGMPVKYDYKENMLVADPANEGGLLVARHDEIHYLVPSFRFFQTKNDYVNYYEQYYSCARPMSGNVWIIEPATVSRVEGGWQLSRRGELEVRS